MSHIREPYLKLTYLSGDPVRESSIAGDLVHPHCIRQFNKLILEDDLEIGDNGRLTVKQNTRYKSNLMIMASITLDYATIETLLDDIEIRSNLDLIRKCIESLYSYSIYSYPLNPYKTLHILRLYLDIAPDYITYIEDNLDIHSHEFRVIKSEKLKTYEQNNEKILDLICNYTFDTDKVCSICLSTFPVANLIQPCHCRIYIHINCHESLNRKCIVCESECSRLNLVHNYCNQPETRIFFPFDDYYPVPMITNAPLVKYKGDNRYSYAVLYLQYDRLEDLFKTNPGYIPQFNGVISYFLRGSMYNNYMKCNNITAYEKIYAILKKYVPEIINIKPV
jgi:hypothetical protein